MDWQKWISLAIVGATMLLFLRARFSRRKFSFERSTGCGSCAASHSSLVPQPSVVFRARKG